MTSVLDSRPQQPSATPTRAATPARRRTRGDIQGLRAVAVLAVITGHLFGVPAGGFVGVDIFFVVSGFLITGLLLKEHARSGHISFGDFYRRRVRRIIPVSVVVLVCTTAAANLLYLGARAQSITQDALWSLLFSANWRFAATGTDYFNAENDPSPLQHYWSLAVEEQFYLLWPALVLAALAAGAGRGTGRRRLTLLATLIVGVSFAWAVWQSVNEPTVAYFSTLTRAWELGVGALVALAAPRLARLGPAARTALTVAGLGAWVSNG